MEGGSGSVGLDLCHHEFRCTQKHCSSVVRWLAMRQCNLGHTLLRSMHDNLHLLLVESNVNQNNSIKFRRGQWKLDIGGHWPHRWEKIRVDFDTVTWCPSPPSLLSTFWNTLKVEPFKCNAKNLNSMGAGQLRRGEWGKNSTWEHLTKPCWQDRHAFQMFIIMAAWTRSSPFIAISMNMNITITTIFIKIKWGKNPHRGRLLLTECSMPQTHEANLSFSFQKMNICIIQRKWLNAPGGHIWLFWTKCPGLQMK